MNDTPLQLLTQGGRLLLEYNESAGEIYRTLIATAYALEIEGCEVSVSYRGIMISIQGVGEKFMPVRELRFNSALQARVHEILSQVQKNELEPSAALSLLQRVESDTPKHSRSLMTIFLGFAAASLARLLGGDFVTAIVVCISTSLGFIIRQEMGKHRFSVMTLPFVGGLVGAIMGGAAIRLGWTQTPELALIVPSLMIVPGPHLINSLSDLFDNHISVSINRLFLASSMLVAIAFGVVLGVELVLQDMPTFERSTSPEYLNVFLDMLLAGIVVVGFALYYNTPWTHMRLTVVGGMIGHGLRFVVLELGWGVVAATFFGCMAVGIISTWGARKYKVPIAVTGFAGAVTMMPGLQIYRALSGFLRISDLRESSPHNLIASAIGDAVHASLVIIVLAVGLILASRFVLMFSTKYSAKI